MQDEDIFLESENALIGTRDCTVPQTISFRLPLQVPPTSPFLWVPPLIFLTDTLTERTGVQPISPIKVSVTIQTLLNFDGDFDGHGNKPNATTLFGSCMIYGILIPFRNISLKKSAWFFADFLLRHLFFPLWIPRVFSSLNNLYTFFARRVFIHCCHKKPIRI